MMRVSRVLLVLLLMLMAYAGTALALSTGEKAPPLALLDSHGELVSLDQLRGRVVYVDFWASWCGPCKRSFPWMNELQRRYHSRGLTIVGINVDKRRTDADRFLREAPASFTILFDAAGVTPNDWGVRGMPSSYLIDPQGRIALIETGFVEGQKAQVEARIQKLLDAN